MATVRVGRVVSGESAQHVSNPRIWPDESHTDLVGSRCESDNPGHLDRSWPGNGPRAMKQVADERARFSDPDLTTVDQQPEVRSEFQGQWVGARAAQPGYRSAA